MKRYPVRSDIGGGFGHGREKRYPVDGSPEAPSGLWATRSEFEGYVAMMPAGAGVSGEAHQVDLISEIDTQHIQANMSAGLGWCVWESATGTSKSGPVIRSR